MSSLLWDADDELVEALLRVVFESCDYWPKILAATILNLPHDEEYEGDELLEAFAALEQKESTDETEKTNWTNEGV